MLAGPERPYLDGSSPIGGLLQQLTAGWTMASVRVTTVPPEVDGNSLGSLVVAG
jgi:hypothetical protein